MALHSGHGLYLFAIVVFESETACRVSVRPLYRYSTWGWRTTRHSTRPSACWRSDQSCRERRALEIIVDSQRRSLELDRSQCVSFALLTRY